jgi:hypothetical protein
MVGIVHHDSNIDRMQLDNSKPEVLLSHLLDRPTWLGKKANKASTGVDCHSICFQAIIAIGEKSISREQGIRSRL